MPDVTLINIADGVRTTWGANATLIALVPVERLYLDRTPPKTTYPNATVSFKDVSAYFGGTEYFSGSAYTKQTQVQFAVYGFRDTNWSAISQAMNDAFGWSTTAIGATWSIENATILAAMPETESLGLEDERIDGEDIVKYTASITVVMQAERG